MRLHIGSGPIIINGWKNIDIVSYSGVDALLDVTEGIPYTDVEYIFAEHFLEHLSLERGSQFLKHCREALQDDGVLRLSTPNLDWVWLTHYRHPSTLSPSEALVGCLELNRAFHGWGHAFLYNAALLTAAISSAGFADITFHEYGNSDREPLRCLERHERAQDLPGIPHVLIVEATGRSRQATKFLEIAREYLADFRAN